MKKPDVLIIVLNFNGWHETIACVDAVLKQSYNNYRIYLIDNGSKDESLTKLKKFENHNKITYYKNPVNDGFSGGVNIGIRYAIKHDYTYVALLNNDAIITDDWLKSLIDSSEQNGSASTTGLLLNSDGTKIESTGDGYSAWGLPFPRQRDEPVEDARDSEFVFGGTAGATLYKTELFQNIGLFDETFFAYFEDTDISFRAQLAGYTAYYEKSAIAYHDHGTTSSKIPGFTVQQSFQNLPLFFWKDVPAQMLLTTGVRFFACFGLMYVRAIMRGQFIPATKGLLRGICLFPRALHERRRIQSSKRVTLTYLKTVILPDLPPNNKKYARKVFHR